MRRILDPESSSTHVLNADAKLPVVLKGAYIAANWANNVWRPRGNTQHLTHRHFTSSFTPEDFSHLQAKFSPARALADLFIAKVDWKYCQSLLGGVRIFDTGCGTGEYALKLRRCSGDALQRYTGVDIRERKEWPELMAKNPWMHLKKLNSSDVREAMPDDTSLIFTVSAIEHFEKDIRYFARLNDFVATRPGPVLQIHIFPAAAGLPLYVFHGVRQYTPRTVGKLVRCFSSESTQNLVYSLGGPACNRLHFRSITVPIHLGKPVPKGGDVPRYVEGRNNAICTDAAAHGKNPTLYALLLLSNGPKGALSGVVKQ
jgi:SAM-dependent methyltransferase